MLHRYLFRRFLPVFIGSVAFFSFVVILIDVLMNLWNYINNQVAARSVFHVMLLYAPKAIWYAVPFAVLFASSYTLSAFSVNNELTAIFASGISLFQFTAPLLLASFIMSFGLFYFEDRVVVPTYARKNDRQNELLHSVVERNNARIVVLAERGEVIYRAGLYDDAARHLHDADFLFRNGSTFVALIHADTALWDEDRGRWQIQNALQYSFSEDNELVIGQPSDQLLLRLVEPPVTFRNNTVSVETVTTKAARAYIEQRQRAGFRYAEELSVYYKKYAFSFVVFIVVFLSIGLSGKTRKNVVLLSLASSITAAVLFYVMQMVTMLLAKFEYISPFSGAWVPVIVFTGVSVVLVRFART